MGYFTPSTLISRYEILAALPFPPCIHERKVYSMHEKELQLTNKIGFSNFDHTVEINY